MNNIQMELKKWLIFLCFNLCNFVFCKKRCLYYCEIKELQRCQKHRPQHIRAKPPAWNNFTIFTPKNIPSFPKRGRAPRNITELNLDGNTETIRLTTFYPNPTIDISRCNTEKEIHHNRGTTLETRDEGLSEESR